MGENASRNDERFMRNKDFVNRVEAKYEQYEIPTQSSIDELRRILTEESVKESVKSSQNPYTHLPLPTTVTDPMWEAAKRSVVGRTGEVEPDVGGDSVPSHRMSSGQIVALQDKVEALAKELEFKNRRIRELELALEQRAPTSPLERLSDEVLHDMSMGHGAGMHANPKSYTLNCPVCWEIVHG